MSERESVADAREDWQTAERDLDVDDRDPDYGQLWATIEQRRQAYQRAITSDRDDSERDVE